MSTQEAVTRQDVQDAIGFAIPRQSYVEVMSLFNRPTVAEVSDTTPAPLDPSKVKAGDTVTLEIHDPEMAPFEVLGEAYKVPGQGLSAGGWPISNHPHVTLTAHQPAPEPEPEWKPGTVADIEVDGGHTYRAIRNDGDQWDAENAWTYGDSEVTDVRPLVVIDPADERFDQDCLAEVACKAYSSAPDVVEWETVANAIRAHLGIETAS
jgi:hypothetical protein